MLNKYHSLFTLFIEHLITISINRLKSSKSTPDILLSLQLLAYVFDICPSFISDDVLLEIPSCVFSWIIGDGNHYNAAFSLKSLASTGITRPLLTGLSFRISASTNLKRLYA